MLLLERLPCGARASVMTRGHVDFVERRQHRRRALRFDQPPGNRRRRLVMRMRCSDAITGRTLRGWRGRGRWAAAAAGCAVRRWALVRVAAGADGILHVLLRHPAGRAGALHGAQVDVVLAGPSASPSAWRGFLAGCRPSPRPARAADAAAAAGVAAAAWPRFARPSPPRRRRRFVEDGEQLADLHVLTFLALDAADHAGALGVDLEVDFLGLELDDRVADFDAVAFLLQPTRDARFDDGLSELWNDDVRHMQDRVETCLPLRTNQGAHRLGQHHRGRRARGSRGRRPARRAPSGSTDARPRSPSDGLELRAPADIAERARSPISFLEQRTHELPGAHVLRLFLQPDDVAQRRIAVDHFAQRDVGEWIELFDADDGDVGVPPRAVRCRSGRRRPCRCRAPGA